MLLEIVSVVLAVHPWLLEAVGPLFLNPSALQVREITAKALRMYKRGMEARGTAQVVEPVAVEVKR